MAFTSERLRRLEHSLGRALEQEWPQVLQSQLGTAKLQPVSIVRPEGRARTVPAVATVATDGGENRLNLEPIRLQVLRVADSCGQIYFEEFIPNSLSAEDVLRMFFKSERRLAEFLRALGLAWEELLPNSDFQRSHLLSMVRELMEWAALLELAGSAPPKLLIRDGLLRSVLLSDRVFQRLAEKFEERTSKHGHLLAGVAKRSNVINYLSLALDLRGTFAGGAPAYVRIPPALEREAAPAQYRWIGTRAMGWLHLARLDKGEAVSLMPIDTPSWQRDRVADTMGLLHISAQASFPLRGYPQPLIQAHEHARLSGLEVELLEGMLLDQMRRLGLEVARQARHLRLLGKRIVQDMRDYEPET